VHVVRFVCCFLLFVGMLLLLFLLVGCIGFLLFFGCGICVCLLVLLVGFLLVGSSG